MAKQIDSRGADFYHGGFLNVSFHQKLGKNDKVHIISKLFITEEINTGALFLEFSKPQS